MVADNIFSLDLTLGDLGLGHWSGTWTQGC